MPDPLFDSGTIIGKVFWDKNENGVQDKGEAPIPNVQIAAEEGTLITTDKDGKYHLPAIMPGRHLLRLDERTLPKGAYLTTDKAVVANITPGLLIKVNFGVNSEDREQMPARITQGREKPSPRLNVALHESAADQYEFRIFTNYSLFVEKWKLEILDKSTKVSVKEFEGGRLTINEPIDWDGKDKNGKPIKEGRDYVYLLTVTGKDGRQDVTKERELKITSAEERKRQKRGRGRKTKMAGPGEQGQQSGKAEYKDRGRDNISPCPPPAVHAIRVMKGDRLEGGPCGPIWGHNALSHSGIARKPERLPGALATDVILPKGI